MREAPGALFELLDARGRGDDATGGPWSVVDEGSVHFGAPGEDEAATPVVFRVQLPAGAAGVDALTAEGARLLALEAGLASAGGRVERVLARDSLSFSSDAADDLAAPERELLARLDEGVSFAADADEEPSRIEAFLADLWRRATCLASVETCVGGAVAATRVSLLGDATTHLRPDASPDDARLHHESLATALRTRRAWTRIVLSTLKTAALIGSGNVLVALPAAWKFIRAVMKEAEALRSSPRGGPGPA